MKLIKFALLSLLVTTGGCATTQLDWTNPSEISSSIEVEYDEFKKVTKYVGPIFSEKPAGWLLTFPAKYLFLRAWKYDTNSDPQYQIYVSSSFRGDWRFYDRAYDSDGNKLDTTVISRDVGHCGDSGCSLYEILGINVEKEYLENHTSSGIRFKVEGKAGEEVFSLPASYIVAFLNRVGL